MFCAKSSIKYALESIQLRHLKQKMYAATHRINIFELSKLILKVHSLEFKTLFVTFDST